MVNGGRRMPGSAIPGLGTDARVISAGPGQAARGPGDLAKDVMVPEAAERGRVPLERATGLSGVTERLASTIGAAAGGSLVALLGPLTGLVVNAGCFALGSVIIGLALPRGMGPAAEEASSRAEETGPGYWRRFGEGSTFLRGEPLLLTVIVMVGITNLLDAAFTTVLMPVWARESGNGPTAIGLTGGVMGAAAVAVEGGRRRRRAARPRCPPAPPLMDRCLRLRKLFRPVSGARCPEGAVGSAALPARVHPAPTGRAPALPRVCGRSTSRGLTTGVPARTVCWTASD